MSHLRQKTRTLACILAIAATAAVAGGQWPQFHGPARNNISTEKGLLKAWPQDGPELLWTARGIGHGYSGVSVADGMIYTAGSIEKNTVVSALDIKGKVLWQVANGGAWTGDRPGSRGTPTIDGGRCYHESPLGDVLCLDAKSGRNIWQVNILEKFKSKTPNWALAESLLVDGDRVICCPGGPETAMVALDKGTGEVVWKAPSVNELAGYASPVLAEQGGLRIILTLTAKALIGVDADSGGLLFHQKHESYADENVMVPLYSDGCVFISTLKAGSVKWKLEVDNGKASLRELWRTEELDCHHGGVVLLDGRLHGNSTFRNSRLWVCLDWQTGEKQYQFKGVGKGSLTCADGMLYTLCEDRVMGLVEPNASEYRLVSSFALPETDKGKSWAHPVVCDGKLYIRHGDFLYAYSVR